MILMKAGDGVGILTQIPSSVLFRKNFYSNNVILPRPDDYAVGMFFPRNEEEKTHCIDVVNKYFKKFGLKVLVQRKVPTNANVLGYSIKGKEPSIYQFFVSEIDKSQSINQFESKLFLARRNMEIDLKSFDFFTLFRYLQEL